MVFTDTCHGDVNVSSLWHPSDLVPRKPTADIIVNAVARAPGGRPLPSWECGLRVEGPEGPLVDKLLRVTGPRQWVPRWRTALDEEDRPKWREYRKLFHGWELSKPEPVTEVPLRYELAYGGTIEKGKDENGYVRLDGDPRNPIGRGLNRCRMERPHSMPAGSADRGNRRADMRSLSRMRATEPRPNPASMGAAATTRGHLRRRVAARCLAGMAAGL